MKLKQNSWNRIYLQLPRDRPTEAISRPPYLVDGFFYSSWASRDDQGIDIMVLTKLTPDGKAVDTFGDLGTVRIPMPGEPAWWLCFVISDNYIVCGAALRINEHFAIFRLDKNSGALDRSFGKQGFKLVRYPAEPDALTAATDASLDKSEGYAGSVPQFPDGKLRQAVNSGLAQFDMQGNLDTSFNKGGMRRFFNWQGRNLFTLEVVARYEGLEHAGFYYCGMHRVGGDDVQAWVGACDKHGAVVASFAEQGVWIVKRLPGHPNIAHLSVHSAVQVDDRLYVVGSAGDSGFVFCLKLDGSPDQSFNGGNAIIFARDDFDRTKAIAVTPHNEGVLVSFVQSHHPSGELPVAILRLNHSGQVDSTFGNQGWLLTPDFPESNTLLTLEHEGQQVIEVRGREYVARYPL
ncbi:hypothetical protein [Pseudomonas putida]|uniref:hypothetical protein n=1 Tax=Pseudomonas putida TaxID=303 RepID=UPI0009A178CC|nr:hypothetical protein [Pseudomonas putida]